jgi:hypothetical protein
MGGISCAFSKNPAKGLASCGEYAGDIVFFTNDPYRPE